MYLWCHKQKALYVGTFSTVRKWTKRKKKHIMETTNDSSVLNTAEKGDRYPLNMTINATATQIKINKPCTLKPNFCRPRKAYQKLATSVMLKFYEINPRLGRGVTVLKYLLGSALIPKESAEWLKNLRPNSLWPKGWKDTEIAKTHNKLITPKKQPFHPSIKMTWKVKTHMFYVTIELYFEIINNKILI